MLALPQQLALGEQLVSSSDALCGLRDVFFAGNGSAMARRLGELPAQLNAYGVGSQPTPLHVFLRASYVTGASIHQILVSQQFDSVGLAHRDADFALRRGKREPGYDEARVDEALRQALAGSGELSVNVVACSLNLDPPTVWRKSGELARQLAVRHASFVAQRSARKKEDFIERVRSIAKRYKAAGIVATAEDIKQELDDAGCGINEWKRTTVSEVLAETFAAGFKAFRERSRS
ncbi:hypothetical protein [Paraburkholderia flagellata]|uniref:hypothetical protein n=1 Tax=Paraburkholderia flagellata TaxID=2883241 RepID=UPI001F427B3C|nr:hypothetical protein [Paraburkholderia flagellata]